MAEQNGVGAGGRDGQVQSVKRAVALLACFTEPSARFTLSDLARRAGINVSTAYRILQTLCAGGMLRREDDGEGYLVGPVLLSLGRSAYATSGLVDGMSILHGLVDETQESASLGIRDGGDVLVLLRVESAEALRFNRPPGTRVPLHASAMGKAILAFSRGPLSEVIRGLGPLAALTPNTITSARRLEKDLKLVRGRGYTLVDEEQYLGVRSVGAPVAGADGVAVAAVAVQGPVSRMTDDRLDRLGDAVRGAAEQLEVLHAAGLQFV